jgi:hydroxyacid-oxoacid transhydrogenase
MAAAAGRSQVTRLLGLLQAGANSCPCHSHAHTHAPSLSSFSSLLSYGRNYASAKDSTDYAFEMAASNIRFGPGVTR